MPTLLQLPQVPAVDGVDLLLVARGGETAVATVDAVRAGLQEAIALGGNQILGRRGPTAGPPEPLGVGAGLTISGGQVMIDTGLVAPLHNPSLTGSPTAPTPRPGDFSNAIATTAYVQMLAMPTSGVILTGDATGSGITGGPVQVTLQPITTPGTYTKVSVNAKGLVTAGGSVAAADVFGLATVASTGRYADLAGAPAPFALSDLVSPGTYVKVTVNSKGLVVATGTLTTADVPGLATVATTGNYADLVGVPTSAGLPDIVAAGAYSKVSVNAKGLVTAGGSLVASDVVRLAAVATSGRYSDLAGVPASYSLPIATGSTLGAVKLGAGLTGLADGTLSLAQHIPGVDGSSITVVSAVAGAVARQLSDSHGDIIRVADLLGSRPGGKDATGAMVLALSLAAATPGSTIELCAGDWNFPSLSASLTIPSRTTVRGAGRHQTRVTWPDTGGFALFASAGTGAQRASDIVLRDFTVTGSFATNGPNGPFPFLMYFVDGLQFRDVCSEYSRVMGLVARNCTDVHASGCIARFCAIDGINFAQCSGVTVEGCTVEHCDDDGIAVHSDVFDPGSVRRAVIISGNRLFDCQGIKVLAPRGAVVVGNTIDRCRALGISFATLAANNSEAEGMSAGMASVISGNVITNIVNRLNIDNLNQNAPGILVTGSSARPGTLGAVPGEPSGTAIIDPYPYFNANSTAAATPTPGTYGLIVTNNFIGRTLPACNGTVTSPSVISRWSDYGGGLMFTRNGWLNPSLSESDLRDHAIVVSEGVVRDVLISGNVIRGMQSGLALLQAQRLDNIVFRGNQVLDCLSFGVLVATTGSLRAYIEDNLFDLDPFLKHPKRGPNGTWTANGDPTGIKAQAGGGVSVKRNIFRNLCRDSDQSSETAGGTWLFEGNTLEADPISLGFSTANKGVGFARTSAGTVLSQTDSNPASATFGQILTAPTGAATAMPASGKWATGHFVRNSLPALANGLVNLGWLRQTTGANNVLWTDWTQATLLGGPVSGPVVLAGPASGSSVPAFRPLTIADVPGVAPAPSITTTYVASGAISPLDNLALINSGTAVSMTLGTGAADGHPLIVKRFGAGSVALTATIDGVAGTRVQMSSVSLRESVSLAWSASLGTWLLY